MRGAQRQSTTGFTLIELLVVIAIMMVLVGMVMGAMALVRRQREKVLASKQVNDIMAASEAYFMMMHQYPPDTGTVDTSGSTVDFTSDDPAEADAIYMYLGRRVYEPESSTKYGNFLIIHPTHLKVIGTKEIMVDPWGMPYSLDCVHVRMSEGAAAAGAKAGYVAKELTIARVGAPYDPADATLTREKQLLSVKAWSAGPDKAEGTKPFSHVQTITDPEDDDNIASWR